MNTSHCLKYISTKKDYINLKGGGGNEGNEGNTQFRVSGPISMHYLNIKKYNKK